MSERPPHRATTVVLTAGTLTAGACLAIGLGLGLLGVDPAAGEPRRLDEVLGALVALRPWGWSMAGVLVLIATPALGLLATALELRAAHSRAALLALSVLAILLAAAVLALR